MTGMSDAWAEYARWLYRQRAHHARYKRYIEAMPRKLVCQDCGGMGGETEPILDDGSGPFEQCGWCEGTGYVTRWGRGLWLRWRRDEKQRLLRAPAGRQSVGAR